MAAFLSRTVDGALKRGGRRGALNQFWTKEANAALALTTVGALRSSRLRRADVWVASLTAGAVTRVHGSDGRVLETWTGASNSVGVLSAIGRIFVTAFSARAASTGSTPSQPAGAVTTVATNLGGGAARDRLRRIADLDGEQRRHLSIVTPAATLPWTVTTVLRGNNLIGALFDGANVWVTDGSGPGTILKMDSAGTILQTVTLGGSPLRGLRRREHLGAQQRVRVGVGGTRLQRRGSGDPDR